MDKLIAGEKSNLCQEGCRVPAIDTYLYLQDNIVNRQEGTEIMRKMGICTKCGKYKIVQEHHSKGYLPPYEDFTEPYCLSCDHKAHNKAKREGKCNLEPWRISKLSKSSSARRTRNKVKEAYKERLLTEKSLTMSICDTMSR